MPKEELLPPPPPKKNIQNSNGEELPPPPPPKKKSGVSPSSDTPSPSTKFDPKKYVTLPNGQKFVRKEDTYEAPIDTYVPPKEKGVSRPLPPSKPVKPVTTLKEAIENAPESQTPEMLSETPENVVTTQPKEEGQVKSLPTSQQPYAGSGNENQGVGLLPSAVTGAINLTSDIGKGLIRALYPVQKGQSTEQQQKEVENFVAYKLFDEIGKYGEQSPYSPVGITEKLGQAAGSLVPFIMGSALSAPYKIGRWVTPALMGATSNAESNYREALSNGATPDQAMEVFWKTFPIGSLEGLPLMNWGKRINALTKGRFNSFFADALKRNTAGQGTINALGEGFEEMATDILNNAAHMNVYDDTRTLVDGAFESGMLGFVLGKGVDAIVSTLEKRRDSQPLTPAEKVAYDQAIAYTRKKAQILEGTQEGDLVANPITSPEIEQLSDKKVQLESDLMKPDLEDAVKEQIGQKIQEIESQIEEARGNIVEQDKQVVETKQNIAELESERDNLQSQIDNASPATQEILQPQMDEILSNLEQLKVQLPQETLTQQTNDKENIKGVSSEIGVGQEPIETEPIESPSTQEINLEKQNKNELNDFFDFPLNEITTDSANRIGSDFFDNLFHGSATPPQLYRKLDIPTRLNVFSRMVRAIEDDKVFRSIVPFIPIDMMNDFVGKNFASKNPLSYKSMFIESLSSNNSPDIVSTIMGAIKKASAINGAKIINTFRSGRGSEINNRTITTDKLVIPKIPSVFLHEGKDNISPATKQEMLQDNIPETQSTNAETIRGDEGQIQKGGIVGPKGESQGGSNLQFNPQEESRNTQEQVTSQEEGMGVAEQVTPTTEQNPITSTFEKGIGISQKIKSTEGAAKRKKLSEQRMEAYKDNLLAEKIDRNLPDILNQLESKGKIKRKGDCP